MADGGNVEGGGESGFDGLLSVMSTSGGRRAEEAWDDTAAVNVESLSEREDARMARLR